MWFLSFFIGAEKAFGAAREVKVGVYHYPPYAFTDKGISGITVELLDVLNQFQTDYRFVPVATTPKRRYNDFDDGKFDMLIFESKSWGWKTYPVNVSQAFLKGGEVYVAMAKKGRDQSYFDEFKSKAMIAVLGYHYKFARFNADTAYLNRHFNIQLTGSHEKCIELLLNKRGDMTVLPKAYLNYYFAMNPADKDKLLISDKLDQVYRHTVLLRDNLDYIDIMDINKMLFEAKQNGVLTPLWQKHQLEH
jgi:ABC-type amino acid transport substrate-binding protein